MPAGANLKNAFTRKVIPLFLVLAHSGEAPWLLDECDIEPLLQEAWNRVYGQSLPLETSKGTVPYELVLFFLSNPSLTLLIIAKAIQRLSELRTKFGSKAIAAFYQFYRKTIDADVDITQDSCIDELAEYAADLMPNKFIYKGMEDLQNVRISPSRRR